MKRKLILILLATMFLNIHAITTYAVVNDDPASGLPFKRKLKWADALFGQGSVYTAQEYYFQLLNEKPDNAYITFQLAECMMLMNNYNAAAEFYGRTFRLNERKYANAPFKEGMMLKQNGDYVTALEKFTFYRDHYRGKNNKMKTYVQKEIDECVEVLRSRGKIK